MMPKLDTRLRALADLVRPGSRCADIGTDHGHLIAWLALTGQITVGYACDINEKPLEKAAFCLRAYGVENKVKLRLCDGLSGLSAEECDDIVIAGMGGDLIWSLIEAASWTRDSSLRFILQPMTRPERLRRSLCMGGFSILRETPIVADRFAYSAMLVCYTGLSYEASAAFCYGGLLWEDKSAETHAYFSRLQRMLQKKTDGLRRSSSKSPSLETYDHLLTQVQQKLQWSDTTNPASKGVI